MPVYQFINKIDILNGENAFKVVLYNPLGAKVTEIENVKSVRNKGDINAIYEIDPDKATEDYPLYMSVKLPAPTTIEYVESSQTVYIKGTSILPWILLGVAGVGALGLGFALAKGGR